MAKARPDLPPPEGSAPRGGLGARIGAWRELAKPGLMNLVLITTGLGFLLATSGPLDWLAFAATVLGTALVGGGANGLNQWWERHRDARMARTRNRPLPSGRLSPLESIFVSVAMTGAGLTLLVATTNSLATWLAFASWGSYVFLYTPLKPVTTLNTLVGAIPGAIPPLIGWTAAAGTLGAGGWVLFAILFVWQIPHFLAIAWLYREDYEAGGFRMLPAIDPDGEATFRMALFYCVGMLPVSWAAVLVGLSGWVYLAGSTLLGLGMLRVALRLYRERTSLAARALFLTTIAYLPTLLLVMLLDPTRIVPAS